MSADDTVVSENEQLKEYEWIAIAGLVSLFLVLYAAFLRMGKFRPTVGTCEAALVFRAV